MKGKKKAIWSVLFFVGMACLTCSVIFQNNDAGAIWNAINGMNIGYFIAAVITAVFFVAAEGIQIWYLLRAIEKRVMLFRCVQYSFIGFFFSGITPSATGGQPAQLYYMKKDGISIGNATLVLMAVATAYKLVLVLIGIGLLLGWRKGLLKYLGNYMPLYYLGLFLNISLVLILVLFMCRGGWMQKLLSGADDFLVRIRIFKRSEQRKEKIQMIAKQYQQASDFFQQQKKRLFFLVCLAFFQRISLFFLTYLIYRGLHGFGSGAALIMVLQAAIYLSVDMLPLPGAQGISELMYHAVFMPIFPADTLTASMCVTRGLSFYFLLLVSGVVCLLRYGKEMRGMLLSKNRKKREFRS